MKIRILSLLFIICIVISCKRETIDFISLSGKIENLKTDSIYIRGTDFYKAIALVNGEFKDTLSISTSGYFEFISGNEHAQLFLHPDDSLTLFVNQEQFDETLRFTGSSANENNYLVKKYLEEEKMLTNPERFFTQTSEAYKAQLTEYKTALENDLRNTAVSDEFKEFQLQNITYDYLMLLDQYATYYPYFTGEKANITPEISKELNEIESYNEEWFSSLPSYKSFVMQRLLVQIDKTESVEEIDKIIASIPSTKIKNEVLKILSNWMVASNPDFDKLNNLIQKHTTDKELLKNNSEKYNAVKRLSPGNPSPEFTYNSIDESQVSLSDLKGKLVYIDVWATWCGPCLIEIPALKELESDYHSKNIVFVSISIDEPHNFDKWKKMVKDKELGGIQLFADKNWQSDFIKAYAIDAIPRFILIDTNGNIINSNAPRPSDPLLREQLNELL